MHTSCNGCHFKRTNPLIPYPIDCHTCVLDSTGDLRRNWTEDKQSDHYSCEECRDETPLGLKLPSRCKECWLVLPNTKDETKALRLHYTPKQPKSVKKRDAIDEAEILIRRYRKETPRVNQPHMIAYVADEWLSTFCDAESTERS